MKLLTGTSEQQDMRDASGPNSIGPVYVELEIKGHCEEISDANDWRSDATGFYE